MYGDYLSFDERRKRLQRNKEIAVRYHSPASVKFNVQYLIEIKEKIFYLESNQNNT